MYNETCSEKRKKEKAEPKKEHRKTDFKKKQNILWHCWSILIKGKTKTKKQGTGQIKKKVGKEKREVEIKRKQVKFHLTLEIKKYESIKKLKMKSW